MAKLQMKRIEILALLESSKEILDLLQVKGIVELNERVECDFFTNLNTHSSAGLFQKHLEQAKAAYDILSQYAVGKGSLFASLEGRREITVTDYLQKSESKEMDEYLQQSIKINLLDKSIKEDQIELAQIKTQKEKILPWLALDIEAQTKSTAQSKVFVGHLPQAYRKEELEENLTVLLDDESFFHLDIIDTEKDRTYITLISHDCCAQDVDKGLKLLGFSPVPDELRGIPAEQLKALEDKTRALESGIESKTNQIKELVVCLENLEFLIDYFSLRIEKYENLEKLSIGNNVFFINGYVAEKYADSLAKELKSKFSALVTVTQPDEDEDVPVLLSNKPFAAGVEGITEMYSLPGKDDYDPNPVMAFFYYALFGIMLSDAGYGLLMVLAMLFAKLKFKLEGNMKKTVDMFLYCGLSTVVWGALFGSWFGDIIQVVASEFFGKEIPSLAIWFEPVDDPMKMLLYSFLFGIMHLFLGLGIRFYTLWKNNQKLDAVLDVVPVYLLVTGIAPIGAGVVISTIPDSISSLGKKMALIGALLIVLTSGRSAKNIIGKLGGGLYALYNAGAGYMGDILSYSRLLALGLSTGVVASVVNLLGTMPQNKVLKAIMMVAVFIFGQTVNLAINLIGAYVHTNRLFFVEFFSKFYEGGGRAFTPLKMNTNYLKIKEEK
ncbi:MAG: V-type ATP synthase subunit I [Clostridiales bacterium]|nr:V-type ATP synthase subunit I [Clostridiales bacterium]